MILTTVVPLSGQIGSGLLGNQSVVSGSIASGQIVHPAFGSGAILSGDIASGQIGPYHLASGAVRPGSLTSGAVQSGNIASGSVTWDLLASGAVLSGNIASGQVGARHIALAGIYAGALASGAVVSGNVASGQLGGNHFALAGIYAGALASGAVQSGNIASGVVTWDLLGSGSVLSGMVGSGQIGPNHVASGAIQSGKIGSGAIVAANIASGQIFHPAFGSGAIQSGDIASGQIGPFHLASGIFGSLGSGILPSGSVNAFVFMSGTSITAALYGIPILSGFSGFMGSMLAAETISGGRAISITQSGLLQIAMAGVSGRMPAIGVVKDNVLSGGQPTVYAFGLVQLPAGNDYSGWNGQQVFVGRSGQLVVQSGSYNSGGFASGDLIQPMGIIWNSGGVYVKPGNPATSGSFGTVNSGSLQSGIISQFAMASGAINSGHVASGAVLGFISSGSAASIASGSVGWMNLGSGSVLSGMVGSGQIGTGHLAAGSVNSGTITAGVIGTPHFISGAILTDAQFTHILVSGRGLITEEIISGVQPVCISQSGNLRIAMAGVSGRMPAIGVVPINVLSGIQADVYAIGPLQLPVSPGLMDYSGYLGRQVFVGRSGFLVTASGGLNSGGFVSGNWIQPMGVAYNSGGILLRVGTVVISG